METSWHSLSVGQVCAGLSLRLVCLHMPPTLMSSALAAVALVMRKSVYQMFHVCTFDTALEPRNNAEKYGNKVIYM